MGLFICGNYKKKVKIIIKRNIEELDNWCNILKEYY